MTSRYGTLARDPDHDGLAEYHALETHDQNGPRVTPATWGPWGRCSQMASLRSIWTVQGWGMKRSTQSDPDVEPPI